MKLSRLFLVLLCLPTALHASTVRWLVRPEYDHVGFYSESVYKCVKDGKIQLFDLDGNGLLPYAVDSVTDYSDGYALVLEKAGKKHRIVGVLAQSDNDFQDVAGTYYTERYSYCSEGFVSVADAKGRQGYVDVKGYPVIRCQFREARPYRKGWASVSLKEGEAHYIDRYGYTLHVDMQLTDASSFNGKGEALVGNYQKLFVINTDGAVVRKYKMESGQTDFPVRPYDYVFDEHPASFKAERNRVLSSEARYTAFDESGKKGVKTGGSVVVLPQFDEVQGMARDRAIVRNGRLWGIVALAGDACSVAVAPTEITLIPGEAVPECVCSLSVPKDLGQVSLVFDNGDGKERLVALDGDQYRFTPYLETNANACVVRAKVLADGLLQWQGSLTLPVHRAKMEVRVGQPHLTSAYANDKDVQRVKAVVTNLSAFPVEISTSMEVELPAGTKNTVLSKSCPSQILEAGATVDCVVSFKVAEQGRVKVSVAATHKGRVCGSSEVTLPLEPFY